MRKWKSKILQEMGYKMNRSPISRDDVAYNKEH